MEKRDSGIHLQSSLIGRTIFIFSSRHHINIRNDGHFISRRAPPYPHYQFEHRYLQQWNPLSLSSAFCSWALSESMHLPLNHPYPPWRRLRRCDPKILGCSLTRCPWSSTGVRKLAPLTSWLGLLRVLPAEAWNKTLPPPSCWNSRKKSTTTPKSLPKAPETLAPAEPRKKVETLGIPLVPESWLTPSTKFASRKKLASFTDLSRPRTVNTLFSSGNGLVTNKRKIEFETRETVWLSSTRQPLQSELFLQWCWLVQRENRCIRIIVILAKQISKEINNSHNGVICGLYYFKKFWIVCCGQVTIMDFIFRWAAVASRS